MFNAQGEEIEHKPRNGLRFEFTINVGNIVTLVATILVLLEMYAGIVTRLTLMEQKVDLMWAQFQVQIRQK